MIRLIVAVCALIFFGSAANADYVKVTDELTIHYEKAGTGPRTILLVPGWTMNTTVFAKQLAHFADSKDYTVITFDPRSQGLSTHTSEGNYYEQFGRDLDAFIRKLDLKNIVLAGWSNGGFQALSYLHQFGSDRLSGFIMLDAAPSGRAIDNTSHWAWYAKDDADGFCEFFTQGSIINRQDMNKGFAEWMVTKTTPEYLDWIIGVSNMTSDGVAALTNANSFYQEYQKDLTNLEGKLPLLYVVRKDWEGSATAWAKANTPSATVAIMDKHLSFWETPEQFNGPLDAFLKKIPK